MARATAKKPAARRKGASRNQRTASRQGAAGWKWVLLGLVVAGFVAFLWYLKDRQQAPRPASATTAPPTAGGRDTGKGAEAAGGKDAAGKGADAEPRFEFYTLLPNQEVMPGSRPAPAQPPAAATPDGPSFLLQAGSFRSESEADKRRAGILLLGMPVKVVKVPVKPGEAWYRVVVGPFKGKEAADAARASLKGSGVDTLVLKKG